MAGSREKHWGVKKKFREGQQSQVLDTLFFDFIDLAERLQPKVVVAENVKGILIGKAKEYTRKILEAFDRAGYFCRYQVLNAADLGVPQVRTRVFFVAVRKDILKNSMFNYHLDLIKKEKHIPFGRIYIKRKKYDSPKKGVVYTHWLQRIPTDNSYGHITQRVNGKASGYARYLIHKNRVAPCLLATGCENLYDEFRNLYKEELCAIGTFLQDYDFQGSKPGYIIGMSVPPFMTRYVAEQVYKQILSQYVSIKHTESTASDVLGKSSDKRAIVWSKRAVTWSTRPIKLARSRD